MNRDQIKFGIICEKAIPFYKKHFAAYMKLFGVLVLMIAPLDIFFWNNENLRQHIVFTYSYVAFKDLDVLSNVVSLLLLFWFMIAVVKSVQWADEGKAFGVLDAYREAAARYWYCLWLVVVFVFKVLAWALLLIVPGFFVGVYYSLAPMAYLIDGKKGREAFVFSRDIVKPNFNKYLDSMLFALAMVYGICLPLAVGLDYMFYDNLRVDNLLVMRLVAYASVVLIAVGSLFLFIFQYLLYKALSAVQS